jgi:hypothetical protein
VLQRVLSVTIFTQWGLTVWVTLRQGGKMDTSVKLLAPCGLYCGMCVMYQATQANNRDLLERMRKLLSPLFSFAANATADDLLCDGCHSERIGIFCRECAIRDCTSQKSYQGCHECGDFPCDHIDHFPVPTGKKVMQRAHSAIQELGPAAFVEAEEQRYHCPACGQRLYRGARECRQCQTRVDLD